MGSSFNMPMRSREQVTCTPQLHTGMSGADDWLELLRHIYLADTTTIEKQTSVHAKRYARCTDSKLHV